RPLRADRRGSANRYGSSRSQRPRHGRLPPARRKPPRKRILKRDEAVCRGRKGSSGSHHKAFAARRSRTAEAVRTPPRPIRRTLKKNDRDLSYDKVQPPEG